ncbi:MAG: hypothetical protein HYT70_03165 [Candidatus Aenigmarchaeota archaeon]|nr:hypothetical protein [Candidatus Aenigmarchaeota archaeon]
MRLQEFGIDSSGHKVLFAISLAAFLLAVLGFGYSHAFYPPQGPIGSCTAGGTTECNNAYPSYADAYCFDCGGGSGCYEVCEATAAGHGSACDTGGGTKRRCYDECSSIGVAQDDNKCSGYCKPYSTTTSQSDLTACNDKAPGTIINDGRVYTEGDDGVIWCNNNCQYDTAECANDGWYTVGQPKWVSTGACTQKEQVQKEKRNYYVTTTCQVEVLDTQWFDTGKTGTKTDGTTCTTADGKSGACKSGSCVEPAVECSSYATSTKCGQKSYDTCTARCTSDGRRYYDCYASQKTNCVGQIFCAQEDSQCKVCSSYATQTSCISQQTCCWDQPTSGCNLATVGPCRGCASPPPAEGQQCNPEGCPLRCSTDLTCDTSTNKCVKTGLQPCATNGCSTQGTTRCTNDVEQKCDNYGKNCLEWDADKSCNYGCSGSTCKAGPGNTCFSGCGSYCLPFSENPVRLYSGTCRWYGPYDLRCSYSTETCNDFNECTTNSCTPGSCAYTNKTDGTPCSLTYQQKVSDNNILGGSEDSSVTTDSGVAAFAWKKTSNSADIYITIAQPNGASQDILVERSVAEKSGSYYQWDSATIYGPTVSYSATDDSFLVVWTTVAKYTTVEEVTRRYDYNGQPRTSNETIYWYNYSIYAASVKNGVAGAKQVAASGSIKLFNKDSASTLFYKPVVAYSSADNKFIIAWINLNQTEQLCYYRGVSYNCGQYSNYVDLQGAITDANGKVLNKVYFGTHGLSYSLYGSIVSPDIQLKNSPLIAASDDGRFLVLWTLDSYQYTGDEDREELTLTEHRTVGYAVNSSTGKFSTPYSAGYRNIVYDTRGRATTDNPYRPYHALSYSPADKEFVVGVVEYKRLEYDTSSGRFRNPLYDTVVKFIGNNNVRSFVVNHVDGGYYQTNPNSIKLFRTNDNKFIVLWKDYWNSVTNEFNVRPTFAILGKPPVVSNGSPSGTVTTGNVAMSVQTDNPSICRYSTTYGKDFGSMAQVFSSTGGTSHSEPLAGLKNGQYNFYVRCANSGVENIEDYVITFAVSNADPIVISKGSPSGTVNSPTTTISVQTNKSSTCKYSTYSGVAYDLMTTAFSSTGGANHSQTLSGLTNGIKNYYVKCADAAGNKNIYDYSITFSVAVPAWYMFATSTTYNGNMQEQVCGDEDCYYTQGLQGADSKCQSRASSARLGGTWKAWLSDDRTSAASRFSKGTGPYKLVNEVAIASNWSDLTDGTLLVNNIGVDEFGGSVSGNVWTNTKSNGTAYGASCSNWESSSSSEVRCVEYNTAEDEDGNTYTYCVRYGNVPTAGAYGNTGSGLSALANATCGNTFRLYCVEQSGQIRSASPSPAISNGQPSGTITTSSPTLSVQTDVPAICKYSTTSGVAYDSMTTNFTSTGGASHSTRVSGGGTYYVKCALLTQTNECIRYGYDDEGNSVCQGYRKIIGSKNTEDYAINFAVNTAAPGKKLTAFFTQYGGNSKIVYSPQQNKLGILWQYSESSSEQNPYYSYSVPQKKLILHSLDTGSSATYNVPGAGDLIMGGNYTRVLYQGASTYSSDFQEGATCYSGKCGGAAPVPVYGPLQFTSFDYGGTVASLNLGWTLRGDPKPINVTCYLNCDPDKESCLSAQTCNALQLPGKGSCSIAGPRYVQSNLVKCLAYYQDEPDVKDSVNGTFEKVKFRVLAPSSITTTVGSPADIKIVVSNEGAISDIYNVTIELLKPQSATVSKAVELPKTGSAEAGQLITGRAVEIGGSAGEIKTGEIATEEAAVVASELTVTVDEPNVLRVTIVSNVDPAVKTTIDIPVNPAAVVLPEYYLAGFVQIMVVAAVVYFLYTNRDSLGSIFKSRKRGKRRK